MLVLSRRLDETLIIGDDIKITVLGIAGNQVRIGIAAPKEISVHREEVYIRIKQETEKRLTLNTQLNQVGEEKHVGIIQTSWRDPDHRR